MTAHEREPDAATNDAGRAAQPSAVVAGLERLAERLHDSRTAPEPLGVCVFAAGPQACCAETTEFQCALLAGIWVAGAACPTEGATAGASAAGPPSPLEEALAELQAQLGAAAPAWPEQSGTCVYAAGDRARSAEMPQFQCELLGGIWFPGEAEAAETGAG